MSKDLCDLCFGQDLTHLNYRDEVEILACSVCGGVGYKLLATKHTRTSRKDALKRANESWDRAIQGQKKEKKV